MQAVFRALSDPTRRDILRSLRDGPRTSGQIAAKFPTSWATISRHLGILRDAKLITAERDGQNVRYELNTTVFQQVTEHLMNWVNPEAVVRKWIAPTVVLVAIAFTAIVYGQLPDRIPSHYGMNGPDRWSGKFIGAWLLPAVMLGIWAILTTIPRIDPRRANYARFQSTYDTVVASVVVVMGIIQFSLIGSALGWPVRVETMVPLAVGGLFIVIGDLLPRARPTWFFGIRNPWTLSNDVVWERTHRVGGFLMIICGLLVMSLAFLRSTAAVYTVVALVGVLIFSTFPYSYFVWRSVTADGSGSGAQ